MKIDSAQISLPVSSGESEMSAVFMNLENGNYAIRVIHDEDNDGKLNMKWFPPGPVEGYGFSAGYQPGGIPRYKKAEFHFSEDSEMVIELTYP